MKTKFIKLALTAVFGLAIAFIISCIPPMIVIYPANSSSSIAVDKSSSSEMAPSSSSVSVEPSSSSFAEPSSSSVATYTVKYDANGGTGAPTEQKKIHNVPLILSGAAPTMTGYTFASWNTAANGNGTSYAPGANYTTNANVTLYAQWKANTYTVKYDANGGTGITVPANQTKTHNVILALNGTVPAKTGYTFVCWNTAADGSGTCYAPGANYTANASVVLYAKWKANTYAVKYDANGGTGAPPSQEKIHDVPLALSGAMPTKPCNTFVNWNTAANGNGTSYAPGGNYTINASVTLYAQWKHNQNGIINGPSVSYGGETYNSVVICGQTWMARNLNYAVNGIGKCPPDINGGCAVYGRRYDWATAMALDASCNTTSCSSKTNKGICPDGWHIPNDAELSTLVSNVESNKGCTNCAGKHLKTTSGWDGGNGLDSYGFAALPGGIGGPPGWKDADLGVIGHWLNSTESSVRSWSMGYSRDDVRLTESSFSKLNLFSIRCLKD